MCCKNELVKTKFKELDSFIENLENKNGSLIAVLHKAQNIFGYLPKEVQIHIAEKLQVPVSKVYGIITFYSYFNTEPKGKYVISVCMGTACFVRGAGDVVEEFEKKLNIKVGQTTKDNKFTLDVLRCVGACGLAPVVTINDKVYGHVTKDKVDNLLSDYLE
ncbi:NADH-quinone oxidoreductase subunit NuoE [Clostridium cochlearium]|uniref:NAD(P)-dependent iron-only hydrogenase diaphorase component iron-sulfur protein n=1 Tax=Clostridium cochlearium TaxID=1494 RepID=A0A240ALH0_CLOCO|nr:NADH-quinone oxidoreductase subunit NuoE [Clostridium cochlearium]MBV1819089.1 NADH-quinone oxidoreductase subunit NuoE [Bacteroidales bacterium MSK.15.36]NSJ90934.1 NADH-quinone oxidoreductase subunit NuoE [Coprococcus sp. MSK.21.13]MBE6064562.1 NADH-quinone oxidoreductase subunit NuoE [Clostridium cochlearium]MBU5268486.1 NADH-quinone oxidoreductase subunit NuoE [Clostridium cochlearium]MCG4571841.1 NADH-quinone oxidoreductase subunit NuoE [Clostridium cochlearium]